MPVYFAHGFRWPRAGFTGIRVHAIVNNLEDMSVEYIQNENTKSVILESFRDSFPALMQQLEDRRTGRTLEFLEQYDPADELSDNAVSQKFAYVVDRYVIIADGRGTMPARANQGPEKKTDTNLRASADGRSRASSSPNGSVPASTFSTSSSPLPHHNPAALSLNVDDIMSSGPAVTPQAWEAFAGLRDKIAEGEKIGWWVIYNGDPDRSYEDEEQNPGSDGDYDEEVEQEGAKTPTQAEPLTNGVLGQPLPTMLPPSLKELPLDPSRKEQIGTAITHPPPPPLERPPPIPSDLSSPRPVSRKSFRHALSRKSSKANLQPPKNEEIPEPPKLKEISKKEGLRYKFFGRASEKK